MGFPIKNHHSWLVGYPHEHIEVDLFLFVWHPPNPNGQGGSQHNARLSLWTSRSLAKAMIDPHVRVLCELLCKIIVCHSYIAQCSGHQVCHVKPFLHVELIFCTLREAKRIGWRPWNSFPASAKEVLHLITVGNSTTFATLLKGQAMHMLFIQACAMHCQKLFSCLDLLVVVAVVAIMLLLCWWWWWSSLSSSPNEPSFPVIELAAIVIMNKTN